MIAKVLFNFIGHFQTKYHSTDMNVIKFNINKKKKIKKNACLFFASKFYYFTIQTCDIAHTACYHGNHENIHFISDSLPDNCKIIKTISLDGLQLN